MITRYDAVKEKLQQDPKKWLVTGVAGFIGSNLLEQLLLLGQHVVGIDNFSTGRRENLEDVRSLVGEKLFANMTFIEGDVCDYTCVNDACTGIDFILHQAALGSVPRSIAFPIPSHDANVNGFINVLEAAKNHKINRMVFASSSSVYGDDPNLPKKEDVTGNVLSPYAATKAINELYAKVYHKVYGTETVGLRYFNVFGRRQDPNGVYAAVVPKWIDAILSGSQCVIHGDGETSRDFCYIQNVVQANLLAATVPGEGVAGEMFNIALGGRTTLTQLHEMLYSSLSQYLNGAPPLSPEFTDFRQGDIPHSLADVSKAMQRLGYRPTHVVSDGIAEAIVWYVNQAQRVN